MAVTQCIHSLKNRVHSQQRLHRQRRSSDVTLACVTLLLRFGEVLLFGEERETRAARGVNVFRGVR